MKVLLRCTAVLALAGIEVWAQSSAPVIASVVNGASMAAGPIAPGMEALVLGSNLASPSSFPTSCARTSQVTTTCNGVVVLVNGKAAPLLSVTSTAVELQVPFEVTGTSATIQLTNQTGGQTLQAAPFTVAVAPVAPGLFTLDNSGQGFGAFYPVLYGPYTVSNPAKPGDTVLASGTGFGATNPALADGAYPLSPTPVVANVTVTVGGENATVLSAVLASPGIYTVSFTLPTDLPSGNLLVVMNAGGVNTQAGVSIPVAAAAPGVTIAGVSNAASGTLMVESGSWVSIYGVNLSATTRLWQPSDFVGNNLPLQLDGVSVRIDGKAAAICGISPGQINVQVPADTATGAVPVTVTNSIGTATGTVTLAAYAPGLFIYLGWVAALHADGTYVTPAGFGGRPATPGETVELYGSGFGPTTPAVPAGQIFNGAAPLADPTQVRVAIGGVPATVSWAGMVAAGLYQLNVVIPPLADGNQPVAASIGGVATQDGPSIPVQN